MDYIRARRRARATWREITEELQARGVAASLSNVSEVYKRAAARKKWPAGLEPSAQVSPQATMPKEEAEPSGLPFRTGKRKPRQAQGATPKPQVHRSRLGEHLDYIRAQRRARASWRQIAESLGKMGVKVSFQAVADYHGRMAARETQDAEAGPIQAQAAPATGPQPSPFQTTTKRKLPGESDDLAGLGLD